LEAFEKGGVGDWIVVIGNEAADTDTMASSLAMAYHLSHRYHQPEKAVALLQIDREAIDYRPENTLALDFARLNSVHADLLTLDQLPYHRGKVAQMIKGLVLVDHNRPLSYWAGAPVLGIVDHHWDRGVNSTADPRIISMVGSASSLVGNIISIETEKHEPIPRGLADLLLSAIAIDTNGLKKGKAKKADRNAAQSLFARSTSRHKDLKPFMKSLAKDLKKAQSQLQNLTVGQMFSRDYKGDVMYNSTIPVNVGYANIPEVLDDLIERSKNGTMQGLVAETREWIAANKVDVLITMTKAKDKKGNKIRELILIVEPGTNLDEDMAERIYHTIRDEVATDTQLSLKPWRAEKDWGRWRFAWKQIGSGTGRKAIRPIVERAIQEW